MRKEQAMVRAFHEAFEHPVADRPGVLDRERVMSRAAWLREEVEEFIAAETVDEQVDAMADLIYFALGTMVELGVEAAPVFELVHQANMRKLWPDGKPRFGGDGKVRKPATWTDPRVDLVTEIQRQAQ